MSEQDIKAWMVKHGIGYYEPLLGRRCPKVQAVMDLVAAARAEGAASEQAKNCDVCAFRASSTKGQVCGWSDGSGRGVAGFFCRDMGNRCGRWRQRGEEA